MSVPEVDGDRLGSHGHANTNRVAYLPPDDPKEGRGRRGGGKEGEGGRERERDRDRE